MKIVQVVNSLDIGGLERLAIDIAVTQRQHGHRTVIYCLSHDGEMASQAVEAGIPVVVFSKRTGLSPQTLWRMKMAMSRDTPDIVHTHNAVVHHYGVVAARAANVPVVVNTRHGLGTTHTDARQDRIFRATLPWTDKVVMVSESTREFFAQEKGVPYSKSTVILNGIPVKKFALLPARPGRRRPSLRFGTVGRLVPAKDHATLLKAFKIVSESMPEAELTLAGEGPLRPELEQLVAALTLEGKVSLAGPTSDVASFLSGLDVFVLSSVTEGLPVAILEAMAAGLPIVSTRVGGIPEIAPEGSVASFCPPADVNALAASMLQVALEPDLEAKGANARAYAEKHFSIVEMWSQYERLFEELALKRPRRVCAPAAGVRETV